MNRHPGREEQTIHLLKSIELKKGMKAHLGAGGRIILAEGPASREAAFYRTVS